MHVALALLSLALIGSNGAAKPAAPEIAYQLEIVEMKGVGWRASVAGQFKAVARQANATIWTTGRSVAQELVSQGEQVTTTRRMTASAVDLAQISLNSTCHFSMVTAADQDGHVRLAKAGEPKSAAKNDRQQFVTTVSGRKLDQGVLVKFVLEESRCLAVHSVISIESRSARTNGCTLLTCSEVPEIVKSDVLGEWLIPNDETLVVSLGAHTMADEDGKAVVRERLVVLEARPVGASEATFQGDVMKAAHVSQDATSQPLPTPLAPSRSLPQPLNARSKPIPLPPLPEALDDEVTPTSMPNSSEPCASPQTRPPFVPGKPEKSVAADVDADFDKVVYSFAFEAKMPGEEHTGMIPPPAKQMQDDVQYFVPDPDFPWATTQAAAPRTRMPAEGIKPTGAPAHPYSYRFSLSGVEIEIRATPFYNAGEGQETEAAGRRSEKHQPVALPHYPAYRPVFSTKEGEQ